MRAKTLWFRIINLIRHNCLLVFLSLVFDFPTLAIFKIFFFLCFRIIRPLVHIISPLVHIFQDIIIKTGLRLLVFMSSLICFLFKIKFSSIFFTTTTFHYLKLISIYNLLEKLTNDYYLNCNLLVFIPNCSSRLFNSVSRNNLH